MAKRNGSGQQGFGARLGDEPGRPPTWLRIAVVTIAAVAIWRIVGDGIGSSSGPAVEDRAGPALRAVLTVAIAVPMTLAARRFLDRRPLAGIGWPPRLSDAPPFVLGTVLWLSGALIGAIVMRATGWPGVSLAAPGSDAVALAVALPFLVFLYEALPEELLFRGYLYRNLADRLPRWAAVGAQAGLFTAFGVAIGAAGSIDRLVLFVTFALTLGILRVVTESVWACIGYHLAFQTVSQWLSAGHRIGWLSVADRAGFDVVVLWAFPVVGVGLALAVWSVWQAGTAWRSPDPDLP